MRDKVPDGFFGFYIFLSAVLAKSSGYFSIAIEAVGFLPQFKAAHGALILLKIIKFKGLFMNVDLRLIKEFKFAAEK